MGARPGGVGFAAGLGIPGGGEPFAPTVQPHETNLFPAEPVLPDICLACWVYAAILIEMPAIGRLNRVYEILARKRPLTLNMIWRLHEKFGIPAESLIRPVKLSAVA